MDTVENSSPILEVPVQTRGLNSEFASHGGHHDRVESVSVGHLGRGSNDDVGRQVSSRHRCVLIPLGLRASNGEPDALEVSS